MRSQQKLNTPKEKLRITYRPIVDFSFGEWLVEKMLKGYKFVYKHITSTIHQINGFPLTLEP